MTGRLAARQFVAEALALSVDEVAADSDVASLPEWDSLGHVRVLLALERLLGRLLEPAEIGGLRGVADIDRLLRPNMPPPSG